ncbi:MAG: AAA family ATPase, partial [Deltaproteobacteria bacterium]|nr:AAA family ATPase [Deltaproteobacteria bacterium]
PSPAPAQPVTRSLQEVESSYIREVLTQTRGRLYGKDGAAAILGLKPSTLQSRMKKLHIDRLDGAPAQR